MTNWLDLLERARQRGFVGRQRERHLFEQALLAAQPPFLLLYLFGVGGVGKTTLLYEFRRIARNLKVMAVYLDSRSLEPTPAAFLAELAHGLGRPDGADLWALPAGDRVVLLIDTAELLRPLESWLREQFLPGLPHNVLVVMATRTPPGPDWRADPAWQTFMRVVHLQNLSDGEARDFLARRSIPPDEYASVLGFTRGHPLALSLVADLFAQDPVDRFEPTEATDIVAALVERLSQEAPGALHRAALEVAALVRVTDEAVLAAVLALPDARDLFSWLRSLSLMEVEARGIFPHDLARAALAAELRWRDPARYAQLLRRARRHYMQQFRLRDSQSQRRLLSDALFLYRDLPIIAPYFQWQATGLVFIDQAQPNDAAALHALVAAHEGRESADLARYWLARMPQAVQLLRGAHGVLEGVLIALPLEQMTADDRARDPAIAPALDFLAAQPPLAADETATCFRFWLTRDGYQLVSPEQSRLFLQIVQHYLTTPGLVYTLLPVADPLFWSPVFAFADLRREPRLDFSVGGRSYGVYMRDWRSSPPPEWLQRLSGADEALPLTPAAPSVVAAPAEMLPLDEPTFAAAVRDALRNLNDVPALHASLLLRARLLAATPGPADGVTALRRLLREVVEELQQTPRQLKCYRALYHTYIQPAPSQEAAAELIDVPYSSFRRHLKQGIDEVVARLWLRESAM